MFRERFACVYTHVKVFRREWGRWEGMDFNVIDHLDKMNNELSSFAAYRKGNQSQHLAML